MTIEVSEEPIAAFPEYAGVPIIFIVERVLDVTSRDDGSGRFALSERRLEVAYEKDYDAIAGGGLSLLKTPSRRSKVSRWSCRRQMIVCSSRQRCQAP